MHITWILIFISFFYCSLGDSTLYVDNSQYTSGSNCTVNDPCSSIQEAIDVFFAGSVTPSATKLVIYLSSGEYPASGNSEITLPVESNIDIQPLNLTESFPIINCNNFFMSAYNLNISSLHIQGCQDFGIQTLATVSVNIINSNFTDMNTAFKFAESNVMFDNVLIDNVETGIEINLQNYNDSTVYLNQLQISNSQNGILISGNYHSDTRIFQLNNTIIEHVFNGIQIDKYNSVEFTNIQLNDVGNLDDIDDIMSSSLDYNLYGLQISNTPTLNLNSISFNNCSSFLQTSNETLNYPPTSTYAINTYNVSNILLNSISMYSVAYVDFYAHGTLNESLLAAIYIDQSNNVTLRNIETNIISGGNTYVDNMQTRGIYIINTNKIDANELLLQRMGEPTYSYSSQLQAIEMLADQISLTNSTFCQVGTNFPYSFSSLLLFEKESIYLVANNINVENLNVTNSLEFIIRAEYGEINNVISYSNGNTFMLYGEEFVLTNIQIYNASYHGLILENSYTKIQNSSFTFNENDPVYVFCNGTVEIMYCNFENNAGGIYAYSYYLLNIENSVFNNNTSNSLEIYQYAGQTVINSVTFETTRIYCTENQYIITKQSNSIIEIDVSNTCNIIYGTSVVLYISPNSTNSSNSNCNNTCCPCSSINSALSYYGTTYDYFTFILFPGNYSSENNNDKISLVRSTTFIATSGEINFNCDEYCISSNENFFIKTRGLPNTTVTFNSSNLDSSNTAISFQGETLSLIGVNITNFGTGINFNGVTFLLKNVSFTNLNKAIDYKFSSSCDACFIFEITYAYFSDIETPLNLDSNGNRFLSFKINFSNFNNFEQLNISLADGVIANLSDNIFNAPRNSTPVVLNHGIWNINDCMFTNCEDQNSISYTGYGYMRDSLLITYSFESYFCGKSAIQFDSDGDITIENINFNNTKNAVQISNAGNITLYYVSFSNIENPIHISSSSGKIYLNFVTYENCGESYLLANNENFLHLIGHVEHTNSSGFVIDTAGDFKITQVDMVQTNTRPFTINALSNVDVEFYIVYILHQDLILDENGGAVFSNGANLTLSFLQVDGGISTKNGGAIYANNTKVTVDNRSYFTNCNANMGGAIYCENCKYFENDGKFLNNSASFGGSVYISGGSISTSILANFTDSSASYGGAIYGIHITDASFRGDFIQNNASKYGGAIYLQSDVSIVAELNAGFGGNYAQNGAIISCCGNSSSCSVQVQDSSFLLNNEANLSSQGADIACVIVADDYDNNTVTQGAPWGILLILIVVVVVVIVFVLIIGFAYKRKKQRSLNEHQPLINDGV